MPKPSSPPRQPQSHNSDDAEPLNAIIVNPRAPRRTLKSAMATQQSPVDIHLTYAQSFKPMDHSEAFDCEIISALQFNTAGNLLAVGDRGGQIQVYKQDTQSKSTKYAPHLAFQSHTSEFDYLKSIEIEEKIINIKWLRSHGPANYLLSANDRTIKLFRIGDSKKLEFDSKQPHSSSRLVLPQPLSSTLTSSSILRKSYSNGHTYHINSLSVNSDEQTFASSDDLRINVWDINRTDASFVIVDAKPENMDNLSEVITTCTFHPTSCNLLSYSTSKGSTKLCDLRTTALCDNALRHFREEVGYRGFFVEVISSISDAQFSNCGTKLATRDFMGVRIWDTRMESSSLMYFPVQEFLQPHLTQLFENDLIFDKFTVSWSHDDSRIVSGSYHDLFCVAEPDLGSLSVKSGLFQVSDQYKHHRHHVLKPKRIVKDKEIKSADDIDIDSVELQTRVLYSQWHPKEHAVAVATSNELCIFNKKMLFCDNHF